MNILLKKRFQLHLTAFKCSYLSHATHAKKHTQKTVTFGTFSEFFLFICVTKFREAQKDPKYLSLKKTGTSY